jgi:hypothetical protein
MSSTVEPLVLDLVEWIAKQPRAYEDVMDAWRTSCPRLTVWEDAVDRGLVRREVLAGGGLVVVATPEGRALLAQCGRSSARVDGAPVPAAEEETDRQSG